MSYRTAEEIRADAIAFIDARGSGMRTEAGEPIVDLTDSFSLEAARLNVIARYLQDINSIAGWRTIVDDDSRKIELAEALGISATTLNSEFARRIGAPLDIASDIEAQLFVDLNRLAQSQGRPRSLGAYATTVVTLYLQTNDPYSLARGATVKTSGAAGVLYDTTTDLIGVVPAFDPSRNLYFITVSARARFKGRRGNQIVGAINQTLSPISGIISLRNNVIAEGGLDRESNTALLDALEGSSTGVAINTEQGIQNFLSKQPEVFDIAIVGPGDPLMERATAGAVDVYIIGSILQTDSVDVRVNTTEETVVLPYHPIRSIDSVVGATSYTDGGGYLTPENESAYDSSAFQATPDLQWEAPPTGPSATEVVTVTFSYNSLIRRLQRLFDENTDVHVPGSSILIKEGTRLDLYISLKVVILPGFSQNLVESAVTTALGNFVNNYHLEELAEYSDLVTVATTTRINGQLCVDRVDGFVIGRTLGSLSVENLSASKKEYTRLTEIVFVAP